MPTTTKQLMGLHAVASLLGVSRQRTDQLARTKGFPEPVAELKAGRIWEAAAIEEFHANRKRR